LKEKNQANTKKFMDERKNTTMKQNKKREKQKKLHETQLQEISQYVKSVSVKGLKKVLFRGHSNNT